MDVADIPRVYNELGLENLVQVTCLLSLPPLPIAWQASSSRSVHSHTLVGPLGRGKGERQTQKRLPLADCHSEERNERGGSPAILRPIILPSFLLALPRYGRELSSEDPSLTACDDHVFLESRYLITRPRGHDVSNRLKSTMIIMALTDEVNRSHHNFWSGRPNLVQSWRCGHSSYSSFDPCHGRNTLDEIHCGGWRGFPALQRR
ncbi:hypothetical protein F5148DRAFT_1228963 [Russula earlei]|uniref:Uncharacterized protein n=1 Tax=Russula earlei TaxID=71964 RepID=A0ACC0TZC7_9AGAM|nr:hypothetical protein F5148DRAFT_1228963 [Russula earlei]